MVRVWCLLPIVLFAAPLDAATAYKCMGSDGRLSFQDRPCAAGAKQEMLYLPDAAPAPPHADAPAPAADNQPAPPPSPPAEPPIPPPSFYLCTRYDGSRYKSDRDWHQGAAVPLAVLGMPGRSLAQVYGGANGVGVSAPGLRKIPSVPAAQTPFGTQMTWVEDQCHQAGPQEACTYLRGRLDAVQHKLQHPSDAEDQLRGEAADLRQRMQGCR